MYKIRKGIVLQKLNTKETIIFDPENSLIYTFNETALSIFQFIKQGLTYEQIFKQMLSRFDVDKNTLRLVLDKILTYLVRTKIIFQA